MTCSFIIQNSRARIVVVFFPSGYVVDMCKINIKIVSLYEIFVNNLDDFLYIKKFRTSHTW